VISDAEDWDLSARPDGNWGGEWHGTMRINEDFTIDATVVADYEGTGEGLEGLRMKLVYKSRSGSVTFSGSIFEHPAQ